jgi:DNA-binding response OmpR family regulator
VLIVDDDADIVEALAVMLQDRHEVSTASNGLQAWELLQAHPFDAIVLDLMMPIMDGQSLIERSRGAGMAIPILLASASGDIRALAARLGVEHITKPYDISHLEAKLVRMLESAAPRLG